MPDPSPQNAPAAVPANGNHSPGTGEFLGHPKGLYVLFSTELWERFSFYAMRGILTLYMAKVVLASMGAAAGGQADQTYGAYLGFVYAATFVGGMLADRLLGQRRAIYIGGFLMSLAQFTLMTQALIVRSGSTASYLYPLFFVGLALLACGNGFFKPNISTIVGTLYAPGDQRRDSAFTIFYVGINIGAALSSLASAAGESWGWYIGYLLAGTGMIASLVIFTWGKKWIAGRGLPPAGATLLGRGRLGVPNVIPIIVGVLLFIPIAAYLISQPHLVQYLSAVIGVPVLAYLLFEALRAPREESGRMIVAIVLCIFSMLFWGFFELAGSTIQRFVEARMDRVVFGWEMQATFINNVINPVLIVMMGISFSTLWIWLDRRGLEPSSPLKFSLGLLQLGLGFLVLWVAAARAGATGKSSVFWLFLTYFLFTTGELCLSPVGLSMITKLAPARLVGVFMGTWFLSSALANVITGGAVGRLTQKHDFAPVFLGIAATTGAAAVLLFVLTPLLKRQMHGVR